MDYIQDLNDIKREENLLAQGRSLHEAGKLNESLKVLNEVVEGNPKSAEAFYILGNIFHQNGEIGKAIKAFTKVIEIEPRHTDASISLSVLYNDIGKYEKASEIFKAAQENLKNSKNEKQLTVAEKDEATKEVLNDDPHINKKFAYKHQEIADLYMSYSRFDEALYEYKKVITLDPRNLEARIRISKVYAKKGFLGKASEELIALKNEYPNFIPARMALGLLYYSNQKIIEAQREWQKILEIDATHVEAKMYLDMSDSATETSLH